MSEAPSAFRQMLAACPPNTDEHPFAVKDFLADLVIHLMHPPGGGGVTDEQLLAALARVEEERDRLG